MARRGGLIPVGGRVRPFATDDVVLVGDAAGLVSPLTGGGIHTALGSGRAAGLAIAAHLRDGAPPPARTLARAYPRFIVKRAFRAGLDLRPPNRMLDAIVRDLADARARHAGVLPPSRLLSADAWRELLRTG